MSAHRIEVWGVFSCHFASPGRKQEHVISVQHSHTHSQQCVPGRGAEVAGKCTKYRSGVSKIESFVIESQQFVNPQRQAAGETPPPCLSRWKRQHLPVSSPPPPPARSIFWFAALHSGNCSQKDVLRPRAASQPASKSW